MGHTQEHLPSFKGKIGIINLTLVDLIYYSVKQIVESESSVGPGGSSLLAGEKS